MTIKNKAKLKDNYSLSLFQTTPTDIYKKSVQASQMIVQHGEMSGQQLLAWNILVKNAKHQKDYYKENAIIVKDSEKFYKIPRKELMEKMGYESTNRKRFKQALLDMQDIKASWDVLNTNGEEAWASCVLLPFVSCDEDFVTYAFVNHIEPMLFESAIYSKLDLVIQRNLKLDASRKLYDWINRYRTNPGQLTNKSPWVFWRKILNASSNDDSYTKEYKVFKRDKLKPALKEINEISDILVEMIEDKEGTRSIQSLQFRVQEKPKFASETEEKDSVHGASIDLEMELAKLTISSYYKKKIIDKYPVPIIIVNIDYTVKRILSSQETIKNQGAYLLSACESNYAGASLKPVQTDSKKKSNETQTAEIMDAIHNERKINAENMFAEMDTKDREENIQLFNSEQVNPEMCIPNEKSKRKNMHLIPFYVWLANHTWGEPTPMEIVEFTLKKKGL